jgi:microcystin-dependent protein
MTAYNIVSPTSLQAGQPEDVSVLLANLQAIAAVLNGGIDNANINPNAAIAIAKLAGYPSDGAKLLKGDGSWGVPAAGIPPGVIAPFAAAVIPEGWLLCDGTTVSRTTYSVLFGIIGITFGAGDGSTTFGKPDLRGRAPYGVGPGTPGVATLGATEGQANVALRGPHHPHSIGDPGHHHRIRDNTTGGASAGAGAGAGPLDSYAISGDYATTGITVGPAGYSTPNAPSHMGLHYIIKT